MLDMHGCNVVIRIGDFVGIPCDGIVTSNHGMEWDRKSVSYTILGLRSRDRMSSIIARLK